MLVSKDRDRHLMLSSALNYLELNLNEARKTEVNAKSYDAYKLLTQSPLALPRTTIQFAQRAIELESASFSAQSLIYFLRKEAVQISEDPQASRQVYFPREVVLPPELEKNPSLEAYPEFIQRTLSEARTLTYTQLLTAIEHGDTGLARLVALPKNTIYLLSDFNAEISLGRIDFFETSIHGLEVGVIAAGCSPRKPYFSLGQLQSHDGLKDKRIDPSELTF